MLRHIHDFINHNPIKRHQNYPDKNIHLDESSYKQKIIANNTTQYMNIPQQKEKCLNKRFLTRIQTLFGNTSRSQIIRGTSLTVFLEHSIMSCHH